MFQIIRSSEFDFWLSGLRDIRGRARILARLSSAAFGHFGDCAPVGEGVSEMRIHQGPGYRVYFVMEQSTLVVLLTGGDKSSQRRDIAKAKRMARRRREEP